MRSIQAPFSDKGQGIEGPAWSSSEDEILLRCIAAGMTFEAAALEVSEKIRDRSGIACKRRFDQIREALAR